MALSLKDPEVDRLARELAELRDQTLTDAVKQALAETLVREQSRRLDKAARMERINTIIERIHRLPVLDNRSADEIIGYNEHGHFD